MSDGSRFEQLAQLGARLLQSGQSADARVVLSEALAIAEHLFGADSPRLIDTLALLGKAFRSESSTADAFLRAISAHERAMRIAEANQDPRLADLLVTLAHSHELAGDFDTAAARLRQALALFDPGRPNQLVFASLVHVLLKAGRASEAIAFAEASLEHAARGAFGGELLGPMVDLGLALRESGNTEGALRVFRQARDVALAREDVPELRDARRAFVAELEEWIAELQQSLR